jgi:hypothetical protein
MKSIHRRAGALLVACCFVLAALWAAHASSVSLSDARESVYEVFSHGLKVGEVKTVCSPLVREQKKTFRFESTTRINAHFLFFSYSLEKKEEAKVGVDGTLNYRRTSQENGKTMHVAGRLESGVFRFTVEENSSKRNLVIPRENYDVTTMDCPEVAMGPGEKERTLRILDLENLVVVKRKYRWVRDEDVDVNGRQIHCKVVEFEDPVRKGRRWVELDDLGIIVTRQDGKGKGISYSSKLTSLSEKHSTDSL